MEKGDAKECEIPEDEIKEAVIEEEDECTDGQVSSNHRATSPYG